MSTEFQTTSNPSATLISAKVAEMKAPGAFRTISEVAANLDVPQHVLRFWESKFQQVRPLKRGGGRRYYRPEDVDLLTSIKDLLYNQGFTIRGVQKLLRENGRFPLVRPSAGEMPQPPVVRSVPEVGRSVFTGAARREIEGVLNEMKALRELLRQTGV
jgi:DNA-binding transcriptional MerR regulator